MSKKRGNSSLFEYRQDLCQNIEKYESVVTQKLAKRVKYGLKKVAKRGKMQMEA